jgi:hypothetical protein
MLSVVECCARARADCERRPSVARKLLVLVNPVAGSGKALEVYDTICLPIFNAGGFEVTKVETTREGDAHEHCRTLAAATLNALKAIVIVSGDGLVSEVLNGLSRRADRTTAVRTPLAVVPAGSGNGLSKSVLVKSGLPFGMAEAALVVATGTPAPLDLATVQLEGATDTVPSPFLSFLSLSWGFVGDVDLGADFLRKVHSLANPFPANLYCCDSCLPPYLLCWCASCNRPALYPAVGGRGQVRPLGPMAHGLPARLGWRDLLPSHVRLRALHNAFAE